ncbi:PREDICTED: mitotic-spindle organizing protein 2B-like [Nicrophorus vespilloides]|uniref:Mitotic-spindle organizing protein 2B-like n=1 Tax=Nicrophorus vespilloides TaxID=110193 RepID=A0ABM1NHK9_NICVS|nr:PREDICTED: mitotic-spindle organizing protein 2B-like [Nicrophorus vespilloides]
MSGRKIENPSQVSVNLRPYQEELLQLSEMAGIHADPAVLKIIVELLNMHISPHAIFQMLKTMRKSSLRSRKYNSQSHMH